MKITRKTFLSTALALAISASLTACGDKEKEASVAESGSKAASVAAKAGQPEQRFQEMLAYIPAQTAYLFTNKKTLPEEVLATHLQRTRQTLQIWLEMLMEETESTADTTESDTGDSTGQAGKKGAGQKFVLALLEDVISNLSVDKVANIGMKIDGHSALYSLDIAPVLRFEISDRGAFLKTLKRAEKSSGYPVEWEKCGAYDCIRQEDGETGFALVILQGQVAAGFFPVAQKQAVLDHLTGRSKPDNSYALADWDKFLEANHYLGYGDGYINLLQAYDSLEKLALEQSRAAASDRGEAFDEKGFKACSALLKRHVENVPEAFLGITDLQASRLQYEMVLKSSPAVSAAMRDIPNPLVGMQQAAQPVFDLGLNINMGKLRDALTQYTRFLVRNAQELHCDVVKADEVRKSMGAFSMATMMGANQFKSVYVALNDVKIGADNSSLEALDLFASIGAEQPAALLQMLAMLNPAFASIELPDDGSPTKLPAELLPPNPAGFKPEIYLARKDKALNIMVGNTKPALKPFKADFPVFYWNTMDAKRYYDMLGHVLQADASEDEEAQKVLRMLEQMNEVSGVVQSLMGADERGITLRYTVQYHTQ